MEFELERDGFLGTLYRPAENRCPGKGLVVFGGSDGKFELAQRLARLFQARGLTTLALVYWNEPGLPLEFRAVPVEAVEKAAQRLRALGCEKVGLWGISKGAELALLAASLMPELVSCVVAVSPIHIVCQGISNQRGIRLLPCSSWSWRGVELPYAPLALPVGDILKESLLARQPVLCSAYRQAVEHPPAAAVIPVERIGGPVLLLSAQDDSMWPAAQAAGQILARLDGAAFPHRRESLCYPYASHLLVPMRLKAARAFQVERRAPGQCAASRAESFEKTLDFLQEW